MAKECCSDEPAVVVRWAMLRDWTAKHTAVVWVVSCGLAGREEWNAATLLDLGLAVHGTNAAQNAPTGRCGGLDGID